MKKRKKRIMAVLCVLIIFAVIGIAGYFDYKPETNVISGGSGGGASTRILNPVQGISDKEAIESFDESYVYYLMASIRANTLHNPPLSSDTPKIEIDIEGEIYNAEVVKGRINVAKGNAEGEDIIIWTSKQEIINIMRDRSYAKESFVNGRSRIEMVSGKAELFSKGYLKLYSEATGENLD